jgi:hypothetical protein
VPDPQELALAALGWVLAEGGRADRFLALTGLTPDSLRAGLGSGRGSARCWQACSIFSVPMNPTWSLRPRLSTFPQVLAAARRNWDEPSAGDQRLR